MTSEPRMSGTLNLVGDKDDTRAGKIVADFLLAWEERGCPQIIPGYLIANLEHAIADQIRAAREQGDGNEH